MTLSTLETIHHNTVNSLIRPLFTIGLGHGDEVLGGGEEVLLQAGHNQLSGLPLEAGHYTGEGVQQRLPALGTSHMVTWSLAII